MKVEKKTKFSLTASFYSSSFNLLKRRWKRNFSFFGHKNKDGKENGVLFDYFIYSTGKDGGTPPFFASILDTPGAGATLSLGK